MSSATLSPTPRSHARQHPGLALLANWGGYGVVALLVLIGVLRFANKFWAGENLVATILAVGLLGLVATGVAFVTYGGRYADLSVPAIMAFSGIVAVSALRYGIGASLAAGIGAGLAIGAVNGAVVGLLRVNPIIWTLALGSIMDGLIRWLYSGNQVYPDASTAAGKAFLGMYGARVLQGTTFPGVPVLILILAAAVLVGSLVMFGTRFGAQLKLMGSSYEVARLSGVGVRGLAAKTFLISALAAALGGILLTSFSQVGASYVGAGYDFKAVTAVVIGGVALSGGRGSILGVLGGVLIIGLMDNLLSLQGVGSFEKEIVQGLVFIAVVGSQAYYLRRAGRDDA